MEAQRLEAHARARVLDSAVAVITKRLEEAIPYLEALEADATQ